MKKPLSYLVTFKENVLHKVKKRFFGTVTHVETSKKVAALTFDDGPDPVYTPRLLEILEKYEARATFFMIGANARRYPDVVKQVASAGHSICNHTWRHDWMPGLNLRECYLEVRRCQRAIQPCGLKIFRPPKGRQNHLSRLILFLLGFEVVTWNVTVGDYLVRRPESMAEDLILQLKPGCIVDLHDSIWDPIGRENMDRSQTLRAVEMLLQRVGKRFQFVTIQDLLKCGLPRKINWYWSGKNETRGKGSPRQGRKAMIFPDSHRV